MKAVFPVFSFKLLVALLIAGTLSACGFHLRSTYLIPEEITEISVTSFDPYSKLTRDIEAQLRLNKINIVQPAENIANLHLINESTTSRTLSLYQNSSAAEIELIYTANARIVMPNVGTKIFSTVVNRNYLDNPQTALAKSTEKAMLQDEMRAQAASQIIRQMARLKSEIMNKELQLQKATSDTLMAPADPASAN